MSIASLNDLIASAKQGIPWGKSGARTTIASSWFSTFDLAGNPGAGVLAGGQTTGSTTQGIVPTCATPGYPPINAFGGAALGYLSKVDFGSSVACRMTLYDRLFVAGAYSFNSSVSLGGQPSYAARLPNADYGLTELWLEQVTASTGIQSVAVTYTNQAGTAAKSTGTISMGTALTVGRCVQLPLAAGDSGIQKIESVTGTIATVGTFNIMVLRELWSGRVKVANDGGVHGNLETGLVQLFQPSALYMLVAPDSTAIGVPDCKMQIANL